MASSIGFNRRSPVFAGEDSSSAQTRAAAPSVPVVFAGRAREFFGIWLVNLLLSLLTLGIYSAWAHVRTKRYFYRNTLIAGRAFDFHATGLQVLVGRLIVLAGFLVLTLLASIPVVGPLAVVLMIALFPWLLVKSLRFNARMSSWSNVRFDFKGGFGGALLVYLLYPALAALTLYLAWPFADRAMRRYVVRHHALGRTTFRFQASIVGFYGALALAAAWVIVGGGAGLMVLAAATGRLAPDAGALTLADASIVQMAVLGALLLVLLPAGLIYSAVVRNIVFAGTVLGDGHRFRSSVSPLALLWIAISNFVVTVASLGLMLPWARIRMARYIAAKTEIIPDGSLDAFVADVTSKETAVGAAYTDMDGVDVGLPVGV